MSALTTFEKRQVTEAHNNIVINAMRMNKLAYYAAGFLPYYKDLNDDGKFNSAINIIDYSMDNEKLISTSWPLNKKTNDVINKQLIAGYKMTVKEIEFDGI